jgi:multiple sugar transport system substrate-binding protein/alpha-glucoside transport system substrate-binding protein
LVTAGAVVALVGLTAGCGSSKKASTTTTTAPSSGTSAATTAPASANFNGQSFSILGQWTGGEEAAFQAVVSAFNKQDHANGTFSSAGSDETTTLGTKVAAGTPPDIAILSLPGSIDSYAQAGKLKAATAAAQSAVAANFSSVWAGLGTYSGNLYGVPVDASNKSTVWYNANLWKNAGLTSTPTTWTDFLSDAKTLGGSGVNPPISIGGDDAWTLTDWFENIYLRTAGLTDYNKLTKLQIPWTDPTVTTALNTLKQVLGNASLIGSPSAALRVPFTGSVDNVFKASPTSGIVYEASFVATTITSDKDPSPVGTVAKFFPFPSINGSPSDLEAAGDFAVNFTSNAAAQAFSAYLASPQAAATLVSSPGSGFLSANKSMSNSDYPDATSKALGQDIISAGDNVVFDMSDQAPAAFGGTVGKGEYADLQSFLANGNVAAAQRQLQADAAAAFGHA